MQSRHPRISRCWLDVRSSAAALLWLAGVSAVGCAGARQAPKALARASSNEQEAEGAAESGAGSRHAGPMSPQAARAYAAGLEAFGTGDLKGAGEQFARAVRADAGAYLAHVALGVVQERRGESARALESYAAALRVRPDFAPAISARVHLLLELGRAAEAETFARGLVARQPESAAALSALAEVSSARGDSSAAQQLAQKALKKAPDFRPAMLVLARDHYRARRLDLALYTLTAILDGYGPENPPRDKNNADARLLRALIYKEQGKRKAAIEEFSQVLSLRPDLVEARLNLATYMLEAGNASEARPILEEALKYEPSNVLIHLNLGDAYRLLGKPKDALEHLAWVSRKDSSLSQAQYDLGLVYLFSTSVPGLDEGQAIDQAILAFERFKKLEPRAARGAGDDVDELITRARNKKAILEALKEKSEPPGGAAGRGGQG
jgi:tetratricopeptide (TPR) repeat protein